MTVFNLRASNNATFHWTRDLSLWAAVYDLSAATIRMQARTSPFAPDPATYEWASESLSAGYVAFDPQTNICAFVAPESDMILMPAALFYDCRLEFPSGESVVIFTGAIAFAAGVTRTSADFLSTGKTLVGDTVSVDGEDMTAPVALPLSLSAAVSAAQLAASKAQSALFMSALLFG